jgi:hypothetical protein
VGHRAGLKTMEKRKIGSLTIFISLFVITNKENRAYNEIVILTELEVFGVPGRIHVFQFLVNEPISSSGWKNIDWHRLRIRFNIEL